MSFFNLRKEDLAQVSVQQADFFAQYQGSYFHVLVNQIYELMYLQINHTDLTSEPNEFRCG